MLCAKVSPGEGRIESACATQEQRDSVPSANGSGQGNWWCKAGRRRTLAPASSETAASRLHGIDAKERWRRRGDAGALLARVERNSVVVSKKAKLPNAALQFRLSKKQKKRQNKSAKMRTLTYETSRRNASSAA